MYLKIFNSTCIAGGLLSLKATIKRADRSALSGLSYNNQGISIRLGIFYAGEKLLSLLSSSVALSLSVKLVDLLTAKAVLPRASL